MANNRTSKKQMLSKIDQTNWNKLLNMSDDEIVCDNDAPDLASLLEQGRAKIIGRGAISETPSMRSTKIAL